VGQTKSPFASPRSFKTCEGRIAQCGEIGIRTRDAGFPTYRISNQALDCHNSASRHELAATAERVLPSGLPKSVETDPDLQAVVEAWPTLPEHIRAAVLALVGTVRR
jgi:hypothetical protein